MLYDKRWNKTVAPVKIESWRQILLKAADIIERDGWCQRTLYWRRRSCAVGAMNRADNNGHPRDRQSYSVARILAYEKLSVVVGVVESWNDNQYTTAKEVISVMREVAGA